MSACPATLPPRGRASLARAQEAIAAIARGEMIVVVDSPQRENEGDLVLAAQYATPAAVNFMAAHGRGLICVPMLERQLLELDIRPMVTRNADARQTAFHVSVDKAVGTTTGISAADRAATIRALAAPESRPSDFRRPGHVFPLAYRAGGLLRREGHTEAAVDLARLAGCLPAAVICEIASSDGEMARLPELLGFAAEHGLQIVTIAELTAHRRRTERLVVRLEATRLPLPEAEFTVIAYRDLVDGGEHLALVLGDVTRVGAPTSVHSECTGGNVFGSLSCDCGPRLRLALEGVASEGHGAVIYLRGQGTRLLHGGPDSMLRGKRWDAVGDANPTLTAARCREFELGLQILTDLGVPRQGNIRSLASDRAQLGRTAGRA